MAISQNKYINIVSAVGGGETVRQRELIARVFTENYLVPAGQIVEFSGGSITALQNVGDYFGTDSAEYKFATKYFQVNKKGTAPQKIGFAGYATAARSAQVIGKRNATTLSALQAITTGTLVIGENSYSGINLSSATDLANVATLLTAVVTGDGYAVTYDATNARFVLSTVATGSEVDIDYPTGTVAEALGWTQGVSILATGADATTPLDAVTETTELSNNFFSIYFLDIVLGTNDITAIAAWVSAQNVRYMLSLTVNPTNATTIQDLVKSYDGVALTLDKHDADAGFMPMSRIASIDYTLANAALSMYYQQFNGVEPSVNTTSEANTYDAIRVNYYGATSQAGQDVSFYQNGVLQGTINDMGVFANEAWLKDSFLTSLLNLRLGVDTLPANNTGVGLVLATLMDTVNLSLYNGVTLPGKTLNSTQKAYITQLTGDNDAWMKVQSNGYYLTADLVKYIENEVEKYKVKFLYVYSKGDSINYVDGRDIMI